MRDRPASAQMAKAECVVAVDEYPRRLAHADSALASYAQSTPFWYAVLNPPANYGILREFPESEFEDRWIIIY